MTARPAPERLPEVAEAVWRAKYRAPGEQSVDDTWRRVARELARPEGAHRHAWEARFLEALRGFRFLPGGRILAGAGSALERTLFNCFVIGRTGGSLPGFFDRLRDGAVTLLAGGGIGYDFSDAAPEGSPLPDTGGAAPGPVALMRMADLMCEAMGSAGARRGAMMATLRCDHPDIERFVDAKRDPAQLRHFNLSVAVTDAFVEAVRGGLPWTLDLPAHALPRDTHRAALVRPDEPGAGPHAPVTSPTQVPAAELWERIVRAAYDCAEPGVLFVDRIRRANNLWYCEDIVATNPCGEVPLPAWGACNLGSLNLPAFVVDPWTRAARLDLEALRATAAIAVRMLDNAYEVSRFPLPEQAEAARRSRRLGLGITGLADALAMLGLRYDSEDARGLASRAMREIRDAAWEASIALAAEKGPFPAWDRERFPEGEFARSLPDALRDRLARTGSRNSHLLAIAPAGSISLLAGNVSSGMEPIFALRQVRRMRLGSAPAREVAIASRALESWRALHGDAPPPASLLTAREVAPEDQLAMQAALQPLVDNAISKTVTVPEDFAFDRFRSLFLTAHALGLKGCTAFRPNPVTGRILAADSGCGTDLRGACES